MARNLNAQLAQMLDGAPHFRPRRAQLFGDARAADDQRRVLAQQANDVAQARVGESLG